MTEAPNPITPPPADLLAFLDDAEKRLDDVDALRTQIREFRETVSRTPAPTAAEVSASIRNLTVADYAQGTDALSVEIRPAAGSLQTSATAPTVSADATIEATGTITATGEVEAGSSTMPEDIRSWASSIGPTVVSFLGLVWKVIADVKGIGR